MQVQFTVNGRAASVDVPPNTLLVHALREHLQAHGLAPAEVWCGLGADLCPALDRVLAGKPDVLHYQAPASADVPAHMAAWLAWFNTSLGTIDGVARAALAHLWFEAIHPFEDGNGRIGRALVTNPRLLILDEATEGLAPLIRDEIWACLARLRGEGQSVLVIDKYVEKLIELADHHTIIERGQVVWRGSSTALDADHGIWHRYLGL